MGNKIILPMPISINVAYANGSKGRFKTKKYKEWEELCTTYKNIKFRYKEEKGMGLEFSYEFHSNWFNKNNTIKQKDLSNYLKVLEDYLPNVIDGFDDKYIFCYDSIKKVQSGREEVEITFKEIRI